jgi:hypothetical protein
VNYTTGLRFAYTAHQEYAHTNRKGKASIVKRLGLVPFLSLIDIHNITGASIPFIKTHGTPDEGWFETQLRPTPLWDADQLDALIIIATNYADDYTVSPKLVYCTMLAGVPLQTMTNLTGVPLSKLREVVHAAR